MREKDGFVYVMKCFEQYKSENRSDKIADAHNSCICGWFLFCQLFGYDIIMGLGGCMDAIDRTRVGIIGGAGVLGAGVAFCLASGGFVDEIVLCDVRENLARSHAMDIEQAVCETSGTRLAVGGIDDLRGCDIIVNAAGIPEMSAASRDDYLSGNIVIFRDLAERIGRWGTSPVFINTTNPVDVLNYCLCRMTGISREKFVGFSRNDTLRFRWAVSKETGIQVTRLSAIVIGEHGDGQVPLFSRLRDEAIGRSVKLSDAQKGSIQKRVRTWFGDYQKLNSGRSSGWTSGAGVCHVIKLMLTGSDEICPCSVIPDGEYGLSGLSIGLPVRLGRDGVREIVDLEMSGDERAQLFDAAEKIKCAIRRICAG